MAFALGLLVHTVATYRSAAPQTTPIATTETDTVVATTTVVASAPVAPKQLNIINDFDQDFFLPEGEYILQDMALVGFREDIKTILLDKQPTVNDLNPFSVRLQTSDRIVYSVHPATFAFISEKRLIFGAQSTDDPEIEYRFDGEFLVKDVYEAKEGTTVIKGKLTKFKRNRKLAEATVHFQYLFYRC